VSQTIGSLDRALALIDELSRNAEEIGVTELSTRLSMSKNQVFRILSTLKAHGYVQQTENKTYRLGSKFFEIGQRLISQNDLLQVAQTQMDWLRDETGETVHLFVRDGLQAVCVARRESRAAIGLSAQVGRRFLMHAGACPKAILAYQDAKFVDATIAEHGLPTYTGRTVLSRDALEAQLARIRQQGYAESDEDLDPSAYSIAIPIAGLNGNVNTAMSVAGPLHRFTADQRGRALDLLRETRLRIGATLGFSVIPRQVSGAESVNGFVKEGGAQGSSQLAALESE
jgi:IclR family acetate operon transcriptional repressor